MRPFMVLTLASLLGLGAWNVGAVKPQTRSSRIDTTFATNAAFRDGLYLGAFASKHNVKSHAPVGRWATAEDRSAFLAGYERGYVSNAASAAR
jgi:hypothetical protein